MKPIWHTWHQLVIHRDISGMCSLLTIVISLVYVMDDAEINDKIRLNMESNLMWFNLLILEASSQTI